ncbi:putative immunity protein [Mesorhizobium sp. NPDC059025]|uniref:putative immunity protein n=1 Tax=unclassified Mesorhizobium TaxID=325217 RepID=UPI00367E4FF2
MTGEIILGMDDLRAVTAFAAGSAAEVLEIYEASHPSDHRPRDAIEAARAFAGGDRRGKALRDAAWAALRAAQETEEAAVDQAARAAMCAASAAYLHPLARSTQVRHILGAAAHAAHATELVAGNAADAAAGHLRHAVDHASPAVIAVLRRYPSAPPGGGRVGELLRILDQALRAETQIGPATGS